MPGSLSAFMDGTGYKLFTCSALSTYVDCDVETRHLINLFQHR